MVVNKIAEVIKILKKHDIRIEMNWFGCQCGPSIFRFEYKGRTVMQVEDEDVKIGIDMFSAKEER